MKRLPLFLVVLVFAFVACSGDAEEVTTEETTTEEVTDDTPEDMEEAEEEEEEENERPIALEDLSPAIKDAIEVSYPGAELVEADEITTAEGTKTYDVEIKHNDEVIELMYDADANFLGIESHDGEDDGEESDDDEDGEK